MRWLIPLVFLLTSCSSMVLYDYDTTTTFSHYDQYQFTLPFIQDVDDQDYVSLDDRRLRMAISRELMTKGFKASTDESNKADEPKKAPKAGANILLVRYAIEEVTRLQTTGLSYGFNTFQSHFGLGLHTTPQAKETKEGKLIVELIEPQENRVIWRAISKRYLKESMSPDNRRAFINEMVAEMFKNYPPKLDHK